MPLLFYSVLLCWGASYIQASSARASTAARTLARACSARAVWGGERFDEGSKERGKRKAHAHLLFLTSSYTSHLRPRRPVWSPRRRWWGAGVEVEEPALYVVCFGGVCIDGRLRGSESTFEVVKSWLRYANTDT